MRKLILAGVGGGALFVMTAIGAAAADPFLCPVLGEGALNAPGLDGSHMNSASTLPSGDGTILPGNNQAGVNANENALNEFGLPSPTNVPGTAGFTPIWNPNP